MKKYEALNNLLGWTCFAIALVTYVLTLEPVVSYWDTGEFIASIHRLQVPHQPGAPLFLMLYKVFMLFAGNDPSQLAWFANLASAVMSAFTILFLFWTITALARRLAGPREKDLSVSSLTVVLGAGLTGALAYAFSDTFWFSAVETEVYALSSLCSAITFWAILKWEAVTDKPGAGRWLLLIAYLTGLSIGVHLLNLLAIPALVLIWYFRRYSYSRKGLFLALGGGIIMLLLIQYGIIPGSVALAARLELLLVNGFGLPFHSGLVFFILLLAGGLAWGLYFTARKRKAALNTALLCLTYIYIGFASYAMIVLRAQAGTNINISKPDNAFALLHYLSRGQYLQQPLLNGPDFTSRLLPVEESSTPELGKYRRKGDTWQPGAFKEELKYDHTSFFPRMWYSNRADFYRSWLGLAENEQPDFMDNLRFFLSYQVGHLYGRYFMWNFAGRVNDTQGNYAGTLDGNWISGIQPFDELRLGNMEQLPARITENKAHNTLFCLPLLLGLAGLMYQYRKNKKDFMVIACLFLFTGVAIIVYLNQYPLQPRERDYTFAGSFYAFAIWIGLGVAGVHHLLSTLVRKLSPAAGKAAGTAASKAAGVYQLWNLRPALASCLSVAVCLLAVPLLMAVQEWDDHDRSGRTFVRDMAYNYLTGLDKNAILITNADNNTYPLWYLQEVENVRPDVRVAIYQFFGSDSYVKQMKEPMNESAPLPLALGPNSYAEDAPVFLPVIDKGLKGYVPLKEVTAFAGTDTPAFKVMLSNGKSSNYFPTTKFKIAVDREKAIASGAAEEGEAIVPAIEWEYKDNYVSKPDLFQLDLLAHLDWTRPLYLASTSASTVTLGLDDYYRSEGLAVRLTPVKDTLTTREGDFRTGTSEMYANLMHKYRWNGLKDDHLYVDSETVNMINHYRSLFADLALASYQSGQKDTCIAVLDRMQEVLPPRFSHPSAPVHNINTLTHIQMANLYYECNQPAKGDRLMQEARAFITDSLDYYVSLKPARRRTYQQDIGIGLYAMEQMKASAQAHRREQLQRELTAAYEGYRAIL
ncbi:uncharacterized protein DUF2723 [Anseongella ginsenosidimutans]|uniref:Uncharacterized protein DUF2723 n=1 Tax=Anseongella ginsenosidimutans TaxID=496056 RepID=A0A4R3KJI4_9SPHI|nr:DUF2723 domain-containing protein [Anseongella ginsenosidimutans]QEC53835.1 DUF2723 domain-containing protein [Anseongella ginsenosidimutans]TCS83887.1 uncharacterized protein DUF2723 [Anseongella ginsenosidimutans]